MVKNEGGHSAHEQEAARTDHAAMGGRSAPGHRDCGDGFSRLAGAGRFPRRGSHGQKLARRLQCDRPDLKVIFSSGYDCEDFAESESDYLDLESNFLQKPYRLSSLSQMIRELLETENVT